MQIPTSGCQYKDGQCYRQNHALERYKLKTFLKAGSIFKMEITSLCTCKFNGTQIWFVFSKKFRQLNQGRINYLSSSNYFWILIFGCSIFRNLQNEFMKCLVRFAIIFDKKTRKIILYKWYEGKAETGVSVLNYAYNKDISKLNSNGADSIRYILICFQRNIIEKCSYGDWLLLTRCLNNMPVILRSPFIDLLDKELVV